MILPTSLDLTITALLMLRRFGLGKTLVLGVLLVPLGLWSLPPQPCGCIRAPFVRCLDGRESAYRAALKSDLKNLASQEEIYFSDVGTYSADPGALGFVASWGVSVEIATWASGWGAVARHTALGEGKACAIFMGREAPPGLEEVEAAAPGEIVCND